MINESLIVMGAAAASIAVCVTVLIALKMYRNRVDVFNRGIAEKALEKVSDEASKQEKKRQVAKIGRAAKHEAKLDEKKFAWEQKHAANTREAKNKRALLVGGIHGRNCQALFFSGPYTRQDNTLL